MGIRLRILTGLLLTFWIGHDAQAARLSCQDIFEPGRFFEQDWSGAPNLEPLREKLSPEGFAAQGFVLDANGTGLYEMEDSGYVFLGNLKTIQAKYLFEWSDPKLNESLVNYGLTPEQMQIVLREGGQAAGKGFYVSVHPFDSNSYGAKQVTFSPGRRLLLLEFPQNMGNRLKADTSLVHRLALAGIDGLRTTPYLVTWISIINQSILTKPSYWPGDVVPTTMTKSGGLFALMSYKNKIPIEAWSKVAKTNPVRKQALGQTLNVQDLERMMKLFPQLPYNEILSMLRQLTTKALRSENEKDLRRILIFIKNLSKNAPNLRVYSSIRDTAKTQQEKLYEKIVELFDLRMVSMIGTEFEKSAVPLADMKQAAQRYLDFKSNPGAADISVFSKFLTQLKGFYGIDYEIRSGHGAMGDSAPGSDGTIEVTPEAARVMSENPLLTVTPSTVKASDPGRIRVRVDYWSLKNTKVDLSPALPKEMQNSLKAFYERRTKENIPDDDVEMNNLQNDVIKLLVSYLIGMPNTFARQMKAANINLRGPLEHYLFFMALHPFKDGNGRAGRYLYSTLSRRFERGLYDDDDSILLPVYDLDLLSTPQKLREYSNMQAFLSAWVSGATSDEDFVYRAKMALSVFFEVAPEVLHSDSNSEPPSSH